MTQVSLGSRDSRRFISEINVRELWSCLGQDLCRARNSLGICLRLM